MPQKYDVVPDCLCLFWSLLDLERGVKYSTSTIVANNIHIFYFVGKQNQFHGKFLNANQVKKLARWLYKSKNAIDC